MSFERENVNRILTKCFAVYPPDGREHRKLFKRMVKDGSMPELMSVTLTRIIEDPNCVFIVKADGTLKILD